jgi:hypothetical protein
MLWQDPAHNMYARHTFPLDTTCDGSCGAAAAAAHFATAAATTSALPGVRCSTW